MRYPWLDLTSQELRFILSENDKRGEMVTEKLAQPASPKRKLLSFKGLYFMVLNNV